MRNRAARKCRAAHESLNQVSTVANWQSAARLTEGTLHGTRIMQHELRNVIKKLHYEQ